MKINGLKYKFLPIFGMICEKKEAVNISRSGIPPSKQIHCYSELHSRSHFYRNALNSTLVRKNYVYIELFFKVPRVRYKEV